MWRVILAAFSFHEGDSDLLAFSFDEKAAEEEEDFEGVTREEDCEGLGAKEKTVRGNQGGRL